MLPVFMLSTLIAFGQKETNNSCISRVDTLTNLEVFPTVDKFPTVDGGMEALYKEVSKRIKYPNTHKQDPIESKVLVAFIVNVDGQINGKRIIKNITGSDLAEQLLDIVDDVKWEPGFCNGKAVRTLLVLPMIIDIK